MKKTLVQKLCLLGVISFLSYAAAVIFSPLAYPRLQQVKPSRKRFKRGKRPVARVMEQFKFAL